jgi:AcrR family transcriptional regulator
MPPKNKFTNKDIIDAAFKIVQKKGLDALTARAIALALRSSTKPIYSQIKSMEKLKEAVIHKVYELFFEYAERKITGDSLLDLQLNHIHFAYKEKNFFRCFYYEKYAHIHQQYQGPYGQLWLQKVAGNPRYEKLNDSEKHMLMIKEWIFVHGLADLLTYSTAKEFDAMRNDERMLIDFLRYEFKI